MEPLLRMRKLRVAPNRTAGFCLILLLQIAVFFGTSSEAAAQQIYTNNISGDGEYYTYNLSCTKPGYDRFVTTLTMEGIQLRVLNNRLKRTVSTNMPSVTSVEPIQQGIYPAPAVLQGPD